MALHTSRLSPYHLVQLPSVAHGDAVVHHSRITDLLTEVTTNAATAAVITPLIADRGSCLELVHFATFSQHHTIHYIPSLYKLGHPNTRINGTILSYFWARFAHNEQTFRQHWINVPCLLEY